MLTNNMSTFFITIYTLPLIKSLLKNKKYNSFTKKQNLVLKTIIVIKATVVFQ